jgi:hypothetical protein
MIVGYLAEIKVKKRGGTETTFVVWVGRALAICTVAMLVLPVSVCGKADGCNGSACTTM